MPMKVRYTVVNGEVIAEERNGVRRQLVPDPLGSTRALLDNTQTQTDTFSYWPFGEEQSRTGTTATPFRFVGTQGYYRDSTNRTYVRARYLRTDIARWQTPDPIGLYGGDVNLYRYVGNAPVTWTDAQWLKDYGDDLCHRINGTHSCSSGQWSGCITTCGGYHNVKYCCASGDSGNGNCQCIKPKRPPKPPKNPAGTGPNYPTNNPGSGFGSCPPKKPDDGGWIGRGFPVDPSGSGNPPSSTYPPGSGGGSQINPITGTPWE